MIITYITLAVGLIVLVKGADSLISAASKVAEIFRIPSFIIGVLVVAIGTSAPEAAISVFSGIQGNNLLTLGDVVGSSIINIALVLGLTALIFTVQANSQVLRRGLLLSVGIQLLLLVMLLTSHALTRIEAVVLLLGMVGFCVYLISEMAQISRKEKPDSVFEQELFEYIEDEEVMAGIADEEKRGGAKNGRFMQKQVIFLLLGLTGLILGAELVVSSAVEIANEMGWSEEFIGFTVIAFGTSLPELVTCIVAVSKRKDSLALGNIVGSNIFNVLFVLGISGLINPIVIPNTEVYFDILVMIGASALLIAISFLKGKLTKRAGFLFIAYYSLYFAYKLSGLSG
ncbi:calcium/sodium antiporter [Eubacteriaceae bacterium ES3]|nr:calcium/sodium antiporter [Eubacteriaceae bacterium ES3]